MKRKIAPIVLAGFLGTLIGGGKGHSQDLIEYALLAGFISLVAVFAVAADGNTIDLLTGQGRGSIDGASGGAQGQYTLDVKLVKNADGKYHLVTTARSDGRSAVVVADQDVSDRFSNGCFIRPPVIQ